MKMTNKKYKNYKNFQLQNKEEGREYLGNLREGNIWRIRGDNLGEYFIS